MAVVRGCSAVAGRSASMTASLVSSGLLCIFWLMSALRDVVTSLAPTGRAAPEGHCPERLHSSRQVLNECARG